MYSEADLDAAVSAGVLTPEGAAAFRSFVAGQRASTPADEEHFRLLTGFNDIFVSIAILLTLFALNWLANSLSPWAGSFAMAAASWGLGEYFTRQRRMALPSIVLVLIFSGALFFGLLTVLAPTGGPSNASSIGAALAITAGGAWLHWRRFMVPITLAAGAAVTVGALAMLTAGAFPGVKQLPAILFLIGGFAIFALAMVWDISDPERKTRRSDVGFWLHLAAAPMIVHPAFSLLGLSALGLFFSRARLAPPDPGAAIIAIALYLGLAAVALVVDRRALLLLSALWHKARQGVLSLLPDTLRARLPRA